MNFNVDFSDIRSILNYVNDNIATLRNITCNGGNQNSIGEVVTRLKDCLTNKNYLDFEGEPDPLYNYLLRRITFFLMLNTEVDNHQYDLYKDNAIVHLLNCTPQISKYLLLRIIWSLNLTEYFAEAIAVTPQWFATPYLEQTIYALKHVDTFACPKIIDDLLYGIYINVARSNRRKQSDSERMLTLKPYYQTALELLQTYMVVDMDNLHSWESLKKSEYLGNVCQLLLDLFIRCSKIYMDINKSYIVDDSELVFGCMTDYEDKTLNGSYHNQMVFELMGQLNQQILNTLQKNMESLDLNIFVDWCEVDVTEELTLQRQICEACHVVQNLMETEPGFKHPVYTNIKSISNKPLTTEDVIRNSNLGDMMIKLDSLSLEPAIRKMWLDEFLNRGILVFDNDECLETIEGNIDHMDISHVKMVIGGIVDGSDNLDLASVEKLRECVNRTAERFSVSELNELIEYSLSMKPLGVNLEPSSFGVSCIQLFNRFTSAESESALPMQLLLQNPDKFVGQLLRTGIKSSQQQDIVVAFLNRLSPRISSAVVQPNLATIFTQCSTLPADELKCLSTLLARLQTTQYADQTSFFKHFYKIITHATQSHDLSAVCCLVESLFAIMKSNRVADMEAAISAPLLIMCATIADYYRWDMLSYTDQRVHLVEQLLDIIHELRKRFLRVAQSNERKFVLDKIAHLKPITRIYFEKLQSNEQPSSAPNTHHPMEFLRFVLLGPADEPALDLSAMPKPDLLGKLLGIVIRCTPKECVLISNVPLVRERWFLIATLLNRIVVGQSENAASLECLRYTGQNLANVVRNVLLPIATAPPQQWALLTDYVKVVKEFEKNPAYECLFMDAHYVITEILQAVLAQNDRADEAMAVQPTPGTDAARVEMFKQAVLLLRDCEAKELVLKALE